MHFVKFPGRQEDCGEHPRCRTPRQRLCNHCFHVLNGRGRVATKTRERVLAAAGGLGHIANPNAQQFVTCRSRILAIQMPDLDGDGPEQGVALLPTSQSEYFSALINGVATRVSKPSRAHPQ